MLLCCWRMFSGTRILLVSGWEHLQMIDFPVLDSKMCMKWQVKIYHVDKTLNISTLLIFSPAKVTYFFNSRIVPRFVLLPWWSVPNWRAVLAATRLLNWTPHWSGMSPDLTATIWQHRWFLQPRCIAVSRAKILLNFSFLAFCFQ